MWLSPTGGFIKGSNGPAKGIKKKTNVDVKNVGFKFLKNGFSHDL